MKKRIFGLMALGLALCFGDVADVHAASDAYPKWHKEENVWKLKYSDGTYYTSGWFHDLTTDIWYYSQKDGKVLSSTLTPDGYKVSASGRLIDKAQFYQTNFGTSQMKEYSNSAFDFSLNYNPVFEVKDFGIQKDGEESDTAIEGGIRIKLASGDSLEIYGAVYSVGIPLHDQVEDFVTYSGVKGKLYIQISQGRIYPQFVIGEAGDEIMADIIGGMKVSDYEQNKDSIMKLMKMISVK